LLKKFASYITYDLLSLSRDSSIADALNFFIYDTIKLFLLLFAIILAVSVIRSYFPPERTKSILSHKIDFIERPFCVIVNILNRRRANTINNLLIQGSYA
jgi:uncharacterized membrane protein YraQ (UPF0718 family)